MEEVRKKDVLRLFFGREYKHYLVQKVAKHYLKLKSEEGLILRLFHTDGKLEKINDEKITHDAKLRKYKIIKCCIYSEIQIKQQVEEAEEIASDEDSSTSEKETEPSDDDELHIKSSDIALLSETDED